MQGVGVESFEEYLDYLQVHPDEFAALFNTILINVTTSSGSRRLGVAAQDGSAAAGAEPGTSRPIRVWSAGCASGEEAVHGGDALAEVLGLDAFRERVKIYATDVDEDGLARGAPGGLHREAGSGRAAGAARALFRSQRRDYIPSAATCAASVIFGRHDLIQDAPISRVDLLLCRNTLMYFNADAQARIMARFYFSLNPGGLAGAGPRGDVVQPRGGVSRRSI